MSDIIPHVQINVTRNCLLEFLDILYENKCHDICVTYSDYGWHVQYDSPFVHDPEVKKDAAEEEYIHPKMKASDAVGPLSCQSCIKIRGCRQMYAKSGVWPVPHDCFVPDRCKKYPQFEMDSCEECNVIHSCIARYDLDREHWKCAKGSVFLEPPVKQNKPCTAQEIAEASCDGDKDKCGNVCHGGKNGC